MHIVQIFYEIKKKIMLLMFKNIALYRFNVKIGENKIAHL